MSDSEAQILRTEFKGFEKLLTDRFEQTEKHVDEKFKQMLNRLEKMKTLSKETDELLRGKNGNPRMNGRLNHAEKMQKIFLWGSGIVMTVFLAF